MTITKIKCREHGGYFTRPIRRGRPPVRCAEEYPCNAQQIDKPAPKAKPSAPHTTKVATESHSSYAPVVSAKSSNSLRSEDSATYPGAVALAKQAKSQLEGQGWTVAGKAWRKDSDEFASITATRGEETLYGVWKNGALAEPMQYSLWNLEKPAANSKPQSSLPFDPDEVPDAELAQMLVGMKVTWYNRLSGQNEDGYCGREYIHVEHHYSGTGDERPGDRVVKFVDAETRMFRAFRLDQLIKVG